MQSKIAKAIEMKYTPVVLLLTDEKPEGALQFKENLWGCVAAMLNGAARGKTAVFDRKTFGCGGGAVGLGFGNYDGRIPGGIEYFLSTGNQEFCSTEMGKNIVRNMPALEHGEGYKKTPELARKFVESLPIRDIPEKYVVLKPLDKVTDNEEPKSVIFLVNVDQLSALNVLANYARETNDNVVMQFGAGCHQIGIIPLREGESDQPRAVVGLTDISVRKSFEKDMLSFTVPYKMFLEMESNVEGSFLDRDVWQNILVRNR